MSIITAIKSNYGKYLARGVGATALYLVARDAHNFGKIQSDIEKKKKNAKAAQYYLNNTLTVDKPSKTKIDLQNAVYKYELSDQLRGFVNSIIGYFKGLGSMLVNDVVPLGLGLTALLAKKRALPLAKLSAGGLGVYAIYSFFKDGLGIGKAQDLTNTSGQDVVL